MRARKQVYACTRYKVTSAEQQLWLKALAIAVTLEILWTLLHKTRDVEVTPNNRVTGMAARSVTGVVF